MRRRLRATVALLSGLAIAACGPAPSDAPRPATASPTASLALTTYPPLTLLVATDRGNLFRARPDGTQSIVATPCPGATALALAPAPDHSRVAAVCATDATRGAIVLVDARSSTVTPVAVGVPPRADVVAWSPDSRSLAVLALGACRPEAPVCDVHVSVFDIASGSQKVIRADEPMIGGLLWTRLGLAVYRPVAPGPGTLLWDGSSWSTFSAHQLVLVADDGRALLEEHPASTARGGTVWLRTQNGSETTLTRGGEFEVAAALVADRAVTWRDSASGRAFVVYKGGAQVALAATSLACTRPVAHEDWVFCAGGGRIEAFDVVRAANVPWPGSLGESIRDLIVELP